MGVGGDKEDRKIKEKGMGRTTGRGRREEREGEAE